MLIKTSWSACCLFFVSLFASALVNAATMNYAHYDIYYEDFDNDGQEELYLHGKDYWVLLHGDVVTPISVEVESAVVMLEFENTCQTYVSCSELVSSEVLAVEDKTELELEPYSPLVEGEDFVLIDTNGDGSRELLFNTNDLVLTSRAIIHLDTEDDVLTLNPIQITAADVGPPFTFSSVVVTDVDGNGTEELVILGDEYTADTMYEIDVASGTYTESTYTGLADISTPTMHGASVGSFRVNENGAATYSIPLSLPAGTAGVAPELALNYSSQGGNGLLGMGWSLSGLSSISRCRQTLFQDGDAWPITWSQQDRFCLDGQRLRLGGATTGPGGSGLLMRTEIDNHARIIVYNYATDEQFFTVERKDGSISTYGKTANSRQQRAHGEPNYNFCKPSANCSSSQDFIVNSWAIETFADSVGNKIQFNYDQNNGNDFRIASIDYAYDAAGENATANAEVEFVYSGSRPDPIKGYVTGYLFSSSKRLKQIIVRNREPSIFSSFQETRRYVLAYKRLSEEDWLKKSFIEEIQECVGQDCLPATTFEWATHGGLDFDSNSVVSADVARTGSDFIQSIPMDVDGDGYLDIVWLEDKDVDTVTRDYHLRFAIFNPVTREFSDGQFSGGAFYEPFGDNPGKSYEQLNIQPIDYNADGLQDIAVYRDKDDYNNWRIYLSVPATDSLPHSISSDPIILDDRIGAYAVFADANSDGLIDIVTPERIWFLSRNGQPVNSSQAYSYDYAHSQSITELGVTEPFIPVSEWGNTVANHMEKDLMSAGDFNGDGVSDYVLVDRLITVEREEDYGGSGLVSDRVTSRQENYYAVTLSGNELEVIMHLGFKGERMHSGGSVWVPSDDKNYANIKRRPFADVLLSDVNGDGYSDILFEVIGDISDFDSMASDGKEANYQFYLNNGAGFESPVAIHSVSDHSELRAQFNDLNGDGYPDFQYRREDQDHISYKLWSVETQSFGTAQTLLTGLDLTKKSRVMIYDATGNGHIDFVYTEGKKMKVRQNLNAGLIGSVQSVTNGLGAITKINYELLSQSPNYHSLLKLSEYEILRTSVSDCIIGFGWIEGCEISQNLALVADTDAFYTSINAPFAYLSGEQTLASGFNAPALEYKAPLQIVTQVASSAPAAAALPGQVDRDAESVLVYFYEGARMQAGGRGFLGFKKLSTLDPQSGILSTTSYRQDWPFIGYPERTEQYAPDGEVLSSSETSYEIYGWQSSWPATLAQSSEGSSVLGSAFLGSIFPYTKLAEETTYSFRTSSGEDDERNIVSNNQVLQVKTVEHEYDAYGNATEIKTKTEGEGLSLSQTVTNIYDPAGTLTFQDGRTNSYEALGRLSSTSSETIRNTSAPVTKTSSFDYYPSGAHAGLLETETLHPDNADVKVTTIYEYDGFGNQTTVSSSALNHQFAVDGTLSATSATQMRKAESEYDTTGRYVQKAIQYNPSNDDMFTTSVVTERNKFGSPVITNNGSVDDNFTTVEYDQLGREISREDETGVKVTTQFNKCASVSCPTGAVYSVTKASAGGGETIDYFDVLGRSIVKASTLFNGGMSCVATEYDASGRVQRVSTPYSCSSGTGVPDYWSETDYDVLGRVIRTRAPDENGTAEQSYNYNGFSVTITNPLGQVRTERKNGLGELVEIIDHLGGRIEYQYDSHNNLEYLRSHASSYDTVFGNVPSVVSTHLEYDNYNRKIRMNDPDKGQWEYKYNAFGELVWQKDGKGQVVTQRYDSLARMLERVDYKANGSVENHTRWHYDTDNDMAEVVDYASLKVTAVIMASATLAANDNCDSSHVLQCEYPLYDEYGRVLSKTTKTRIGGVQDSFTSEVIYDGFSRVVKQLDVINGVIGSSDIGVENHYNAHGYLEKVTDLRTERQLYKLVNTNVRGQATDIIQGNGLSSNIEYYPETGRIKRQRSFAGVDLFSLQYIDYVWDKGGNLSSRANDSRISSDTSATKGVSESFCYDGLNRLIKTNSNTSSTSLCAGLSSADQDVTYDSRGNIKYKAGVGAYTYDSRPHAVTNTGGEHQYNYDGNGNLVSDIYDGLRREFEYTTFDKPTRIEKEYSDGQSHVVQFAYGFDRSRYWRQDTAKDGTVTTTRYLGGIEKITSSATPNKIQWKRYLGKTAVETLTTDTNNALLTGSDAPKLRYIYKDHLGSVDVITDEQGEIVQAMSFDPWGERRDGNNWDTFAGNFSALYAPTYYALMQGMRQETTRGFTFHEMVDEVGVIHMNGRIYDPRIARFLQADPFVQAPTNTQSLNRYAYVWNNPLNSTDPSGYFLKKLFRNEYFQIAAMAYLSFVTYGAFSGLGMAAYGASCTVACSVATANLVGGIVGGAAAGFASGVAVSAFNGESGSALFKSGMRGALSGAVFGGIGGSTLGDTARIGAHALAGGVLSELQGGNFGHGFWSAGFSKFASVNWISKIGGKDWSAIFGRTAIASAVGGTVSRITGGKFANGARTSAFAHLVNAEHENIQENFAQKGIPVNSAERAFLESGDLQGYYQSRHDRGDPYGAIGLSFWGASSPDAKFADMAALSKVNLSFGILKAGMVPANATKAQIDSALGLIGQDLAVRHAQAVTTDYATSQGNIRGVLGIDQITDFHHASFKSFNIKPYYYGGTPFLGMRAEAHVVMRAAGLSEGFD